MASAVRRLSPAIVAPMAGTACATHVLVLGLNGLVARAAARIAAGVAGTVLFASPYGRGQYRRRSARAHRQLVGLGRNPNVAATLVVGADRQADRRDRACDRGRRQTGRDHCARRRPRGRARAVDRGIRARRGAGARRIAAAPRTGAACRAVPRASNAVIPTRRPAWSRIRSPARSSIGSIDAGGTAVFGETIEWLGAEHLLARARRDTRRSARRSSPRCTGASTRSPRPASTSPATIPARRTSAAAELDRGEVARRDRQGRLAPDRGRAGALPKRRSARAST